MRILANIYLYTTGELSLGVTLQSLDMLKNPSYLRPFVEYPQAQRDDLDFIKDQDGNFVTKLYKDPAGEADINFCDMVPGFRAITIMGQISQDLIREVDPFQHILDAILFSDDPIYKIGKITNSMLSQTEIRAALAREIPNFAPQDMRIVADSSMQNKKTLEKAYVQKQIAIVLSKCLNFDPNVSKEYISR